MSKAILLFDEHINIKELENINKSDTVDIFPLTSHWFIIENVKNIITSFSLEWSLLNSSSLINEEFEKIRENVAEWSANLGEYRIWSKSIKEWFLTPEKEVSTWWFSLLSEKNNLKTDIFLRLAQINAMELLLKKGGYDFCYISISEVKLRKVVKRRCIKHSLANRFISSKVTDTYNIRAILRKCKERMFILGDILHSFLWFSGCILKGFKARRVMCSKGERRKESNKPLLFVSYFPAVDMAAAERGVFINKYAVALQGKLKEMNKPINWLFMYVPIDGQSYNDALKMANEFSKYKESVFLLEEFLSFRVVLNVLFAFLVQILKHLILTTRIASNVLTEGLTVQESKSFMYLLWHRSFVGTIGIQGIVYFELFKKSFDYFGNNTHCIYYAEMQAWEKALNSAKNLNSSKMKTIGFLHTSIPRNNFCYLYTPDELKDNSGRQMMPLPDLLACNGDISFRFMAELQYPNLTKVEAIRQLYLSDYLISNHVKINEQVVLVVGSMNRKETMSLILLINAAFPKKQKFRIWLKEHPATPINYLLKLLNIDIQECGYEIKDGPIDKLLKDATVVVVGDSTVSLEAIGFGCKVILPVFCDNVMMNPLFDFDKYFIKVFNPDELRNAIDVILTKNADNVQSGDAMEFIHKYWDLDKSLNKWETLLN